MRAVVVYRTDGLGSRLMAFGNGLRLARVLDVPCWLTWNEPQQVGGFADLGQLLDMRRLATGAKVLPLALALRDLDPSRICYGRLRRVVDRDVVAGADVFLCVHARMQRLSDEVDSPRLHVDFAAAASCIVPAPQLADRARAFLALHDLGAAVGVHVRRGDLVDHEAAIERRRLIGLDRYFAVLDAVAPEGLVFLCTEDASVVEAFQARCPGRVLRYPTTAWSRGDGAAAADALIEMFLLSATRFIVAGPSGFSRFAASRSAIPLAVIYAGDSVEQSIDLAMAAVAAARPRHGRRSPGG